MLTVYSKQNCIQCEMTKMWLDQNKIPYDTVDVIENPEALELLSHYGWQTLPVVAIDDEISDNSKSWSGFQIDKLEALL